ncbi:MAG: efflux transporter periplasmic adaptor subunit [Akkermansiaceae bacterium]|nr:efflux transporter periplasmic adaptor subunit [Akkermansiaceae bacterium]
MKSLAPYALILPLAMLSSSCSRHADPGAEAAPAASEAAPVKVATQSAQSRPMPRYLRITGELKGSQQANVAADASGKVVEAPIERGTHVKKGDVLFRLDDRSAALSLAEAEATLVSAQLKLDLQRTELARNEPLARTKAISDTDFQHFKIDFASAEASLDASKARRDMAEKTLKDATILSPFDGTVGERLVELGEYVSANSQVASLVATDKLRLVVNVPETSIGQIREDQTVTFTVPAYPAGVFSGKIKFIGASVRNSARDLIIEAEVPNKDGKLKPGMFAEGRISLGDEESVTVPASSVLSEGPTRRVYVLIKDRLEERLVEAGETKDDLIEIRRGVSAGDAVVVTPGPGAADGIRAEVSARS